ncbi:MAG: GWxTD domain-containing protein [Candidatus Aminicenantes bacterium]|nr:GWxTD domain-containing protein [Candidatus Aminicenantes bacterium]
MRFFRLSPKTAALLALCAAAAVVLSSCRLYRLKRQLDAEDALFLSEVRYVITKEETRLYLEMPKSERDAFREDFWEKRDPDPLTETNEFRTEYYNRIEEANRLFTAGRDGWLTDRGRTLILLGPPVHKSFYPMGNPVEGLLFPTEVWSYPNFPIVFIDSKGAGDYEFHYLSLGHQAEIQKALLVARDSRREEESALFDYDLDLRREGGRTFIVLSVGKKNLWMAEGEEGMRTTLEIRLQIVRPARDTLWEKTFEHPVLVPHEEMARGLSEAESIEVEVDTDLPPGNYSLLARVKNLTDGEQRSRAKSVKIT